METDREKCVMVVDDDADIRTMVSQILSMEGYHVVVAANGEEALAHLRGGAPVSLILLDLMMPVMNGWQFRTEQERYPGLAAIPVVVLSGQGQPAEKQEVPAVDYIRKPIDLERLLDTVARHC